MRRRLTTGAGLYVYRDGIRVLPYGNVEHDYLEIETRRSKNAGRYFWSYRNMFGAISLAHEENAYLDRSIQLHHPGGDDRPFVLSRGEQPREALFTDAHGQPTVELEFASDRLR